MFARQVALIGLAGLAYQRNRLDEATDYLDRVVWERKRAGRTVPLPFPLILRARVARARGDSRSAAEALDLVEEAARAFSHNRLRRLARAERAWSSLEEGGVSAAILWADEVAADRDELAAFAREPVALILARVRRAQGAAAEVVPLLERLLLAAEQQGRGHSVVAVLVQLALARHEAGDQARGVQELERAARLAEPEGYVRQFLDEDQALVPPLRRTSSGASGGYATRLLRHLHVGDHDAAPLAEVITPREREVLQLLALGLSNRSIAERLVTSEATAKSHVHRLIGKLGVASRAQVVIRAREMGVLEGPAGRAAQAERSALHVNS